MESLLDSGEAIIRYKARVVILGTDPESPEVKSIQQEIKASPRIQDLLSDCNERGEIPFHPYTKWQGAHWVLACLADIGYPMGDDRLLPLRDQVYAWLLSKEHVQSITERTGKNRQVRMHASMEANALFASLSLGLVDERTEQLVERLLWAQWDDGGWNCDQNPHADSSSFYETITPLRALARWERQTGDPKARAAVERAAEIFLKRGLFRRLSDGSVMRDRFLSFCYPPYWFYDILFGLKVMAEAGFIADPRCQEALDLVESKRLADGGFAAEGRHYTVFQKPGLSLPRGSRVDWGPVSRKKANEFVTADAVFVLKSAGRTNSGLTGQAERL